jgi:N-acetyl-1-D-myo-inositol-2-amino-2-deoxy-alpha-D-glucopyranoside deacetylase
VHLTIVCTTRGEGGEVGNPPVCRQEELGVVRVQEEHCSAKVLGVQQVLFLDYVDPRPAPDGSLLPAVADPQDFERQIVRLLRRLRPDVVVTHGSTGEYGHPQHLATNRAVTAAFFSAGDPACCAERRLAPHRPRQLYYFAAAASPGGYFSIFRNPNDPPTLTVDIAPVLDLKHRAFACHATQIATTLKDARLPSMEGMFPPSEAFHRRYPAEQLPDDLLAALDLSPNPSPTRGGENSPFLSLAMGVALPLPCEGRGPGG